MNVCKLLLLLFFFNGNVYKCVYIMVPTSCMQKKLILFFKDTLHHSEILFVTGSEMIDKGFRDLIVAAWQCWAVPVLLVNLDKDSS